MADKSNDKQRALRTSRGRSGRAKLPLIGAQVSTAGGFAPVPERAVAIGAEVVQIFSSNPRTWRTRSPSLEEIAFLTNGLRRHSLPLYLHTIYLINLASPDEELRKRSTSALAHALATGALTEAAGVVTHVGSHKGTGFDSAATRIVQAIRSAFVASGVERDEKMRFLFFLAKKPIFKSPSWRKSTAAKMASSPNWIS